MNPDVEDVPRFDWELGVMFNSGRHSAVGAALLYGGEESRKRTGITARYRRWLNGWSSIEIGGGPVSVCELAGPEGCADRGQSGFGAEATLNVADLVAVSGAYEHLGAARSSPSSSVQWYLTPESQWYARLKFGSYAAPIVSLGLAILVAATWKGLGF